MKLDGQARQAMAAGREDLARLALQRKQASLMELEGLDQQIADLEIEQEKLTHAEQRLQAKVAAFRTRKEVVKAQYNAAQAQVRIGSALSGISEEMSDVSLAIERAEHKTEDMRARAGAIDELAELGVLDDFSGTGGDPLSKELSQPDGGAKCGGRTRGAQGRTAFGTEGRRLPQSSASSDPIEDELAALRNKK